ncbi:HNH endonuclease [Sphingomonas sp. MMS24-J13]|uniref:HNH endonuclease n=1 Tax=Sphingomonas sp. MMS24-J13 TaxID=3238686 RepID=UPI003850D893
MARGVFLHRADSIYDDRPAEQYQFPKQYLSRASQFVGDWIIYYEPRKGGGRGYYAIARVGKIVPDPIAADMYLALIEPGSYLQFENVVPFSDAEGLVERGLLNDTGAISGRAQAAVRPISASDFNRIVDRAFDEEADLLPRVDDPSAASAFHEARLPFSYEVDRDRVIYLTSRPVRDRIFRKLVLDAYDCRCALTGLKLINGGGRAEVEAAHIRPVEHNGPDTLSNGIALSGTVHWMFDRGLISLSEDLDILVSRQVNDSQSVWSLMNPERKARLPVIPGARPNPAFTRWHRENCFKH